MPPSSSLGDGSVNDDNSRSNASHASHSHADQSHADHAVDVDDSNTLMTKSIMTPDGKCVAHPWVELRGKDLASGQVYQLDACPECNEQFEANKEALRQRRLELDRQLQALENGEQSNTNTNNVDATSRTCGESLDRDRNGDGGSTSSAPYAVAPERNNSMPPPVSSEPHSTQQQQQQQQQHPQQESYRPQLPPPQSSGYPVPMRMPSTEESVGYSGHSQRQQQQQQAPRNNNQYVGGGIMYAQHEHQNAHAHQQRPAHVVGPTRIPSSASVGSVSTSSNHRSGADIFNNNPSSFKTHGNGSYPFSNPYDPQFLAAAASAFHQQQRQSSFSSAHSGSLQQQGHKEGHDTSLLWKLLQHKEDEVKEVRQELRETEQKFQQQSLLATKLQTTLEQVQEAFQKERLLIKLQAEKEAQASLSSRQEEIFQKQLKWMESQSQQSDNSVTTDPTRSTKQRAENNNGSMKVNNRQNNDVGGRKNNGEAAATTNKNSKKMSENKYPWNAATKVSPGKERNSRNIVAPNFDNQIKLYPSIDETLGGEDNNASGKSPSNAINNKGQNGAKAVRTSLSYSIPHQTPMANNNMSNMKNSTNETKSTSSDRFDPVYVVPNTDKDEDTGKEATTYFSNDDDRSLGQTVASSTYGDDRVKVTNKKLLDPYGDKGTYTGVVLRNTGMPHGLGRMVYEEDRRVFEGDWRHGRWHGYGRASFSNGDSYEGEYKFDQRHGTGVYRWNDGRVYNGHFSEDKRHGKGAFSWPDGAVYDGDFVNGQRQGHGKYTFADGGQYEGSWKDGRYDGFGTCTWEDGRRYRGEWRNGMAHGRGTETYPNGNIRHEGEWIDDEPIR
jgi:hypothetical protein